MNAIRLLAPGMAAAMISYALSPLARFIAIRIGALDNPGPRKIHCTPVVRAGGFAVIGALAIVAGAAYSLLPEVRAAWTADLWRGLGLGLAPIVGVSLFDDIKALGARPKVIAHTIGAAIAVWFGLSLAPDVHLFGQTLSIGVLAYPLSILWIVGVTNAFNIVDGLDGLSAGLGLISSLSLCGVFLLVGQTGMASAALVLAGAVAGFLPFNLFPARMYLGDTGATAVGFCLAILALRGGSTLSAGFAVLLPVFVLGLPIAETLISMARRVLKRLEQRGAGGVFEPDKNHMHHRLLALGIDHRRAVLILHGAGFLLAVGALASMLMTTFQAALFAVALLLAGFVGVARLGYDEFAIIQNGVVLRLYDSPLLRKSTFIVFADVVIVTASVYAAVALRTDDWRLVAFRTTAAEMIAVLAPVTVAVFSLVGLYRGSWRFADANDFARAFCAVMLAAPVGLAISGVLAADAGGSAVPLYSIYALVNLVLVIGSRASYQVLDAMRRAERPEATGALIYGAGRRGVRACRQLLSDVDFDLHPIAFIDDDPSKAGTSVHGVPVAGPVRTLDTVLQGSSVRAVIVSSDRITASRLAEARATCERLGVLFLRMQVQVEPLVAEVPSEVATVVPVRPAAVRMGNVVPAFAHPSTQGAALQLASASEVDRAVSDFERWPCSVCGSTRVHRSRARSIPERMRKSLTPKRLFRCDECGWRGWSEIMDFTVRLPASSPALDAILEERQSIR